jgi:hypothetical protein
MNLTILAEAASMKDADQSFAVTDNADHVETNV